MDKKIKTLLRKMSGLPPIEGAFGKARQVKRKYNAYKRFRKMKTV